MLRKKLLPVLAIFVVLLSGCGEKPTEVTYYYASYCESCRDDLLFAEAFAKMKGDLLPAQDYDMRFVNTVQEGMDAFMRDCERSGVPQDQRELPALFVDGVALLGMQEIESTLRIELSALDHSQEESPPVSLPQAQPGVSMLVYFYTAPCQACSQAQQELRMLPESLPLLQGGTTKVRLERYSILDDEGLALLRACFEAWDVPAKDRKVPVVFYADGYRTDDFTHLTDAIGEGKALDFQMPEAAQRAERVGIAAIALSGLVAGLNPCALSMFLFVLTVAVERKKALSTLWYVGGHALAQFMLCVFLTSVLSFLQGKTYGHILKIVQIAFVIAALVLAGFNLWDFLRARSEKYGEIKLRLPKGLRRFNHSVIERMRNVPSPLWWIALVGLGVVVSGGEFLCTGQVTLATLLYMVRSGVHSPMIFMLFVACQAVPMTAAAFLIYAGQRVFGVTERIRRIMPATKFVNALLFVAFAIYFALTL